jgi:NTE family protein
VTINGIEYLDGGIHSPTNADVLRSERLDVVVVVSPMSLHGYSAGVDAAIRVASHRRLEREVRRLEAAGTKVIRFEPGSQVRLAMGLRAMTDSRTKQIVQASYAEVKARAQRHSISSLVGTRQGASR